VKKVMGRAGWQCKGKELIPQTEVRGSVMHFKRGTSNSKKKSESHQTQVSGAG